MTLRTRGSRKIQFQEKDRTSDKLVTERNEQHCAKRDLLPALFGPIHTHTHKSNDVTLFTDLLKLKTCVIL